MSLSRKPRGANVILEVKHVTKDGRVSVPDSAVIQEHYVAAIGPGERHKQHIGIVNKICDLALGNRVELVEDVGWLHHFKEGGKDYIVVKEHWIVSVVG